MCSEDIVNLKILQSDWLKSIMADISGSRFFPSMGLVQEYSK